MSAATKITKGLTELEGLDRKALGVRWEARMRRPTPKAASRVFLLKALSYELQSLHVPQLSKADKKVLKSHLPQESTALNVASNDTLSDNIGNEASNKMMSKPRIALVSGSRLVREWNGTPYTVRVIEEGFVYKDRVWKSLSAIAKDITGAHWSGPRFFGIKTRAGVRGTFMSAIKKRCAVYTRKSTEEGLEQAFNSLDAQLESCRAYILSQAGEGWTGIEKSYSDGGISGGHMERPGLIDLIADIEAGHIDIVVVYKVDRLTRALSDFAKLVDVFDRHNVSFVSITQAFNTTTSMGRLTLNVLLSFAQFEREVTAERIRDKIAASKKRGLSLVFITTTGEVFFLFKRNLHC